MAAKTGIWPFGGPVFAGPTAPPGPRQQIPLSPDPLWLDPVRAKGLPEGLRHRLERRAWRQRQDYLSGMMTTISPGVTLAPGYLDRPAQENLLAALRTVLAAAPLYVPRMPKTAKPMSVHMSNCGPLGWVTDQAGYRYQATHPETGMPWPPMPDALRATWHELSRYPHPPEACLINFYRPDARMGLHQDRDEEDFSAPVVSLSLGDTCLFRLGGTSRRDPTRAFRLASGDALVLGGEARLAFHGVDRILPGTSTLLSEGGRINLTLRRVTRPG